MSLERHISAGNLALVRGLYVEAENHFKQALEFAAGFPAGDLKVAEARRGLAQAYLAQRRFDDAEREARLALDNEQQYWGLDHPSMGDTWLFLGDALLAKGDYERAHDAYNKALTIRESEFGPNHAQTVEVLSKLVSLYLQSEQEYGFEDLHKRALLAYQSCYPTGMWTNFLKLTELVNALKEAGQESKAENVLKKEIAVLSKLLGRNHKEVAALMTMQAALLKEANRQLASWKMSAQSKKVEQAANEQLFLSDQREYELPQASCREVVQKLLSLRGALSASAPAAVHHNWWHCQARSENPNEVVATLSYNDDADGHLPTAQAKLKLTVRFTTRGLKTRIDFDATLANSMRVASANSIIKYTIDEIDQTLQIVPSALQYSATGGFGTVYAAHDGFWPTPQQYNEAIQNASQCFGDLELKQSLPELNVLGLPKPCSGALGTVYQLRGQAGVWAVKCFTQRVTDQAVRYGAFGRKLAEVSLPYFVPFRFLNEGIRVSNEWFPIVQMRWVDAEALNVYVARNLGQPSVLAALSEQLVRLVGDLQNAGIAHGDLQHGNILLKDNQMLLVDYDGMWVPELSQLQSSELGHPNYQHPRRAPQHFGIYLDNFAGWLIYCTLVMLSRDPSLWEALQGGDECLLLRRDDLLKGEQSPRIYRLLNHADGEVQQSAAFLCRLLTLEPDKVPSFSAVFSA